MSNFQRLEGIINDISDFTAILKRDPRVRVPLIPEIQNVWEWDDLGLPLFPELKIGTFYFNFN